MAKRRIRLGATPEKHVEHIERERVVARNLITGTRRELDSGACQYALSSFKQASHAVGAMFANIVSLPGAEREKHDNAYDGVARDLTQVQTLLVAKCFRGKGRR